ncbi:hypothetical protein E4U21_000693 [Claviceps maximensis]|nr:hypothetical protein E4U21_000693 [Claviceps maximensis]
MGHYNPQYLLWALLIFTLGSTVAISLPEKLSLMRPKLRGLRFAISFGISGNFGFLRISRNIAIASRIRNSPLIPPKLDATLLKAAAIVAEHVAAQEPATTPNMNFNKEAESGTYWMKNIRHTGLPPMGANSSYPVFRDVTDPMFAGGAKGDGVTDDTAAINGTLVFFPSGTYLISSPILVYNYSQLVGDATNLPVIKTSPSFIGLGAIQTDVYAGDSSGGECFYRQVRNFIARIGDTKMESVAGLHWQVAQATSLTNVAIYASPAADTTQIGIFVENGSGGFMSDCTVDGGKYGLYGDNQQFTVRGFMFSSQTDSCICLLCDWGWIWSNLIVANSPVSITLLNPEAPAIQPPGSIYLLDTSFLSVQTAVKANAMKNDILETSIMTFDNVHLQEVKQFIEFTDGSDFEYPDMNPPFLVLGNQHAVWGSIYGKNLCYVPRPPNLQSSRSETYTNNYFVRSRPQHLDLDVGSVVSVKDHGAKGDGATDDTEAVQSALLASTATNLIYFPAGSYLITSTILVPPHARVTGEVWSQLVASGAFLQT